MADPFSLKEALDIYQTQYSQVDRLWSYFGTFTLAILGFTIGSEKATKSIKEVAAIIIGYLVFCSGNFKALILGQEQLLEFAEFARKAAKYKQVKLDSLYPLPLDDVTRYYWCVVTAVCIGVIFIAWKRQREAKNAVKMDGKPS
jgi:hypothetical protein